MAICMYAIFSLEERISPALVHNITFFEAAGRENSLIAEGKSVIGVRNNPFLAATTTPAALESGALTVFSVPLHPKPQCSTMRVSGNTEVAGTPTIAVPAASNAAAFLSGPRKSSNLPLTRADRAAVDPMKLDPRSGAEPKCLAVFNAVTDL